jgi:hypothetical protein
MRMLELSYLMIVILITSCGPYIKSKRTLGFGQESDSQAAKKVNVNLQVNTVTQGLKLLAGTSFSGTVSGCVSGLPTINFDETDSALTLLDTDASCQFRIDSFTIGSETFDTSDPATYTFVQGELKLVVGSLGSELEIETLEALPVLPAVLDAASPPTIRVKLSNVEKGPDGPSPVANTVNVGVQVSEGNPIPLSIVDTSFVQNHGTYGWAGGFTFSLNCETTVSGTDCADSQGASIDIVDLKTTLIDNAGLIDLDLTDCRANLDYATADAVTFTAPGGLITNGGAVTVDHQGPSAQWVNAKEKTLLIGDDQGSCKYYHFTITL